MAEGEELLRRRRRIFELVVARPGISAREIQAASGTAPDETSSMLAQLEQAGHLVRGQGKIQNFFFAREVQKTDRQVLRFAHSHLTRRVLIALFENPGTDLETLAADVGSDAERVAVRLRPLLRSGLVSSDGSEPPTRFEINDSARVGQLMAGHRVDVLDGTIERSIDLWAELFPP
jgi:predicted transcriptional regulator